VGLGESDHFIQFRRRYHGRHAQRTIMDPGNWTAV
jgi:hypothetical protein